MSDRLTPTRPCAACGAQIAWRTTPMGKKMPIDPEPTPMGTLIVEGDTVEVPKKLAKPEKAEGPRFRAHFASCPNWKRSRR